MTRPQDMPTAMQVLTLQARVVVGPTHCYARAPLWLAIGRTYPVDQIDRAEAEADEMSAIFHAAPPLQKQATAQWMMR